MEQIVGLLENTPLFSRFDRWTLQYMAGLAQRRIYKPDRWLFRESDPRGWFGVVQEGEVRIMRGLDDGQICLAVLGRGGILSERIVLDDLPHTVSGYTTKGAVVVQFPRKVLNRIKEDRPDLHYRIAARIKQLISDRMRYSAERLTIEDVSHLERDAGSGRMEGIWGILGKG